MSDDQQHQIAVNRISARAWLVCLTASLFCFYEFVQIMMFGVIGRDLAQAFAIDATRVGLISSAYFIANLLFMFPAGIILDWMSTKRLIITAMSLCVGGTLLFSFADNLYMAMFGRFLAGVGGAFPLLACLRLATRWTPARRMGLISGVMVTVLMLGGVAGQAPFTYLVHLFGWRQTLRLDALLGVIFIILIFCIVRDYPSCRKQALPIQQPIGLHGVLAVLANRQNWLFGLYTALLNLPVMLLSAVWGSWFLTQAHHFTAVQASYITSMILWGTIIGAPTISYLSDCWGKRKPLMLICAILALIIVLLIMYWQVNSFASMLILFLLLGFTTSSQVISYPAIAESNSHQQSGAALGLASVLIMGSAALFQPLFGWLMDQSWDGKMVNGIAQYSLQSYHHGFLIFPLSFVIGFIAVLLAGETYCRLFK